MTCHAHIDFSLLIVKIFSSSEALISMSREEQQDCISVLSSGIKLLVVIAKSILLLTTSRSAGKVCVLSHTFSLPFSDTSTNITYCNFLSDIIFKFILIF